MRSTALRIGVGVVISAALSIALSGVNSYFLYVINLTLVNAIAAIGLMALSGVAGQMSLGTSALMALGAYGTGVAMTHAGLDYVSSAAIGATLSMVIGTALAAPALRLTGMHLAIVTLAFGVIVVQIIGKGGAWTGGMAGLSIPPVKVLGVAIGTEAQRLGVIAAVFCVVVVCVTSFLRLKPGRALLALRQQETTARALGINTSVYKSIAFAMSSFLAGLSGALYAMLKSFVSVDDFTIWNSIYFFVMICIGGMTSVTGAILGAVVITILPELLRGLNESANAVFGLILMVTIIVLPGGLVSIPARLADCLGLDRRGPDGAESPQAGESP